MEKFIKMLEERGSIKSLKLTHMIVGEPQYGTPEEKKEAMKEAFSLAILGKIDFDEELKHAFSELCYEAGKKQLQDELYKIVVEGK